MPKSSNQKLKILYLRDILYKYTDENHPMSASEIIEVLRDYEVDAERKSIYSDIEMLATYGMDIMKMNGREGGFFLGEREFELAELKMLIDAVQSSRFITKKKSDQLVKKISSFASEYDSEDLNRSLYSVNRIKSNNESILYIIDEINEAIRLNRRITFKYYEWTTDLKLRAKKNGAMYEASPLALIWDDEYYYLVAYDSEAQIIKHYRVDKIREVVITDNDRDKNKLKVNLNDYSGRLFGMFGGKTVNVSIICPNDKIGILIDRFGQDIKVTSNDEKSVKVFTEVALSNQFYGWMASIGPDIKLNGPGEAVEAMKQFLISNLENY